MVKVLLGNSRHKSIFIILFRQVLTCALCTSIGVIRMKLRLNIGFALPDAWRVPSFAKKSAEQCLTQISTSLINSKNNVDPKIEP